MNKVILLGRLGKKPVIHEGEDRKVGFLSVATHESFMKGEEKHTKTLWHRVTLFKERDIEYAKNYLDKGDQVLVEGKLNYRNVQEEDGRETLVPEILIGNYCGGLQLIQKPQGAIAETPINTQEGEIVHEA